MDRTRLTELGWLAYMAQELGWNGLAMRIADDVTAMKLRHEELNTARRHAELALANFQQEIESYGYWCEHSYGVPYPKRIEELNRSWQDAEDALNYLAHEQHLDKRWSEITGNSEEQAVLRKYEFD